uniref:Uncharacterized protein n=1 Tax=viral metagenome TaxID=1070528 RepID=A0A6M3LXG5_9ZZZZ
MRATLYSVRPGTSPTLPACRSLTEGESNMLRKMCILMLFIFIVIVFLSFIVGYNSHSIIPSNKITCTTLQTNNELRMIKYKGETYRCINIKNCPTEGHYAVGLEEECLKMTEEDKEGAKWRL